jgi:hypothetical protein
MIIEKIFPSEGWARGFAEGIEYVNDGAISDVEVRKRNEQWVVSFDDADAKEDDPDRL